MKKKWGRTRRQESLSRERIIEEAIALLDSQGESGLTFSALSERLATGPGTIYWHIASKSELLTAACNAVITRVMPGRIPGVPEDIIRAIALSLFDAIDRHPWVGSALTRARGPLPIVRILEGLGQQVRALGIADEKQWAVASTLLHYILGVSTQNAHNSQHARLQDLDRSTVLNEASALWSELDPNEYPFTRSVVGQMSAHDDREDFLLGIDLILGGIRNDIRSSHSSVLECSPSAVNRTGAAPAAPLDPS